MSLAMEPRIIEQYERIRDVTEGMLAAARAADWDRLVELEQQCSRHFSELVRVDDAGRAERSPAFRQRKAKLIREVLAADAEIRNLIDPWLAELQSLLGTAGRERRLDAAYSVPR